MKNLTPQELMQLRSQDLTYDTKVESAVQEVVQQIKKRGDEALMEYTQRFDQYNPERLYLDKELLQARASLIDDDLKAAIDQSYQNVSTFHALEKPKDFTCTTQPGVNCALRYFPIQRVGLYIPGGTAPLFSTILMLAIPAQLAGCQKIVVCSPLFQGKDLNPAMAYALLKVNIDRLHCIGGAQAVAAMAFGTETVPKVDKIFGPGNQYVTLAKQLVSQMSLTAIDMPAGPSEVLVIGDETARADFVLEDLLSQTEHGTDSCAVLLSTSQKLLDEVENRLEQAIEKHTRKDILLQSKKQIYGVLTTSLDEAIELSNQYGPEHLILNCEPYADLAGKVSNAGSVFMGPYAAESFGDYASGTNHTLPTMGFTNAYSGLKVTDFMKSISFQELTKEGVANLAPAVVAMAEAEGLSSHAEAARIRLQSLEN